MAHHKGGGSSRNGRDSNAQRALTIHSLQRLVEKFFTTQETTATM